MDVYILVRVIPGSITERVGTGRQYHIEWCDGARATQDSIHIFGVFTKQHPLAVGDRVLAVSDPRRLVYLPGWVTGKHDHGDKISVQFCSGLS
jgi:hypothetical protein